VTWSGFWVHIDKGRGRCLIRGDVRDLLLEADVLDRAEWSRKARGWVLTNTDTADLCCLAELRGTPYKVKQVSA
jgi:hypothetical protein